MALKMDPILLHYINPDDQSYAGSEMVAHQNIQQPIQLNQATLIHLDPWKTWPKNTWPIFDFTSQRWLFADHPPRTPLVWREACFYSGRDSVMCPTFISFEHKNGNGDTLNAIDHFAQLIYPKGDRTVKVNSLARLDLKERIHEINDNVEAAWTQWRNCHNDPANGSTTYKYHSRIDAILLQMRRVIDDIFVSHFYKQFRNETINIGFYDVDSFQWLCNKSPFRDWPTLEISTFNNEKKDELKRKRKLIRSLFIGENYNFLDTLAHANNSSKHSYFNTTPRSKIGNDFPTLLMNMKIKKEIGRLEEMNVSLSQMILGFTDVLSDIATRVTQLNTTGSIPSLHPSSCNRHRIKRYELELPRPA